MKSDPSDIACLKAASHALADHEGIVGVRPLPDESRVEITFDPSRLTESDIRALTEEHSPQVSAALQKCTFRLEGDACEACAVKLERRVGDFATVGVAVAVETTGGSITRAGIALTGVGGSTIDAVDAAQALVGGPLTAQTIEQAGELAARAARPRTDHRGSAAFKRHIVHTFVVRLLNRVAQPAERAA